MSMLSTAPETHVAATTPEIPAEPAPPRAKPKKHGGLLKWILLALPILGLVGFAVLKFQPAAAHTDLSEATFTVERSDLRITVVEAGTLQSANSFDVYSELE